MKLIMKIGYNSFLVDVPKEDTGILFNAIKDAKTLDFNNVIDNKVLDVSISVYTPPVESADG